MNRYSETYGGGFLEIEGMLNSDLKIEVSDATRILSESFRNEPFPHVTLSQDKNAVDRNLPLTLSWENPISERSGTETERMGAYVAHRGSIDSDIYDTESFSHYSYSKEIVDLNSFVIPASELQKYPLNSKLEIKLGKIINFDTASNIDLSFLSSISIVVQLL